MKLAKIWHQSRSVLMDVSSVTLFKIALLVFFIHIFTPEPNRFRGIQYFI